MCASIKAVNGQTTTETAALGRLNVPSIVEICTYSRNDLKDQGLPASSWKHRKHIFSLDEVEQGFFLDRFQLKYIGKTTIQRKLYCTTKGSLEFATIVRLCFFEPKKRFLDPLGSIPEIRPMSVLARSLGKVWH